MKLIPKGLTYANVMSTIAVFLVLGGATAFAASLAKNSVGSKQLKKNAVTAAKIKKNAVTAAKIKNDAVTGAKIKNGAVTGAKVQDGSLTGSDINLATLGTVPSATTAGSANSLAGRIPVSRFTGDGIEAIATIGPFTILSECLINNGGSDEGRFLLTTAVNNAAMDDNNGAEFVPFDISDNPAELYEESEPTGEEDIEVGNEPGLTAVAPDGTAIVLRNETIGFNITGRFGQCYFAGVIEKIG